MRAIKVVLVVLSMMVVCSAADAQTFRFTASADNRPSQDAQNLVRWEWVMDEMTDKVGDEGVFHIMPGDFDYPGITDDSLKTQFGSGVIWYPGVGNHEAETPEDMTWVRSAYSSLPFLVNEGPTGCETTTYSFDYGNAHFVSINIYYNGTTDAGTDGDIVDALYNWLAADLAANTKPAVFVIGHEPAYPQFAHVGDSLDGHPDNRDRFWKLLNDEKVIAYLCGHTHYYSALQQSQTGAYPCDAFTWQIDCGNSGNPRELEQTFIDITVTDTDVTFNTWRGTQDIAFTMTEGWTVEIPSVVTSNPSPADGAMGVSPVSLSISATVHNPSETTDPVDVEFFGRENPSFTIIAIGDTQNYTQSGTKAIYDDQMQWIADNAASMNIVFVTHQGDIVNTWDDTTEWANAADSMSIIDPGLLTPGLDPLIPYGVLPGNHDKEDVTSDSAYYNITFPYDRYEGVVPWYGGHYGTTNNNNYQLFSAGGDHYVILHIEDWPDDGSSGAVIAWADSILTTYWDRKAIITTHGYLTTSGTYEGKSGSTQYIRDYLVEAHDNVYFVLCGHSGEYTKTTTVGTREVHELLSCYHADGWLRIMTFDPDANEVHVQTYSPWLDQYQTTGGSDFVLAFDMNSVGYSPIGADLGVPSGSVATTPWPDLSMETQYEWYVTVADTMSPAIAAGPLWDFTTASLKASNPDPANGATDVDVDTDLSWSAGIDAVSHDVYFGTDPGNLTQVSELQTGTTYDPTTLAQGTTYYWAIDEFDSGDNLIAAGDIWTFTTTLPGPVSIVSAGADWKYFDQVDSDQGAWYAPSFDDSLWAEGPAELGYGDGDEATNLNGTPVRASYYFRHTFTAGGAYDNLILNVVRDDGCVVYLNGVELGRSNMPVGDIYWDTWSAAVTTNEYDWWGISVDPAVTIQPGINVLAVSVHQANSTSSDVSFDLELQGVIAADPKAASNPGPADGATNIGLEDDLSWTAGVDAVSHDVYFGTNPASIPLLSPTQAGTTYEPGALQQDTTYYWVIDEHDSVGGVTTGYTWSFTTAKAKATNPDPANGATDVGINADLTWTAGVDAISHDVYFGTDPDPHTNTPVNTGSNTYDPGTLNQGVTYYWAIDEHDSGVGVTTGDTWSFTTAPPSLPHTEDFESGFTIGQTVGSHPDWYDGGAGPVVTSGNGLGGSVGLGQSGTIFTWTAHPFVWTEVNKVIIGMDFQTDGSAHLDDDRIGWMISDTSTGSSDIFGVQLDPGGSGYNIEGYWDGSTADRRPSIVSLPTLSANAWYRLRAEFTRLTDTSAGIDVELWSLDAGGNPVALIVEGSIADTSTLGADAPHSKYFPATNLWPGYKNYTAAPAPADNAYFEEVPVGGPPPVISNVQTSDITDVSAMITWTTDKPSDSVVRYGETTSLGSELSDAALVTSHSLTLTGLSSDTLYYYEVESTDADAGTAIDDNGGAYYTFTTVADLEDPVITSPTGNTVGTTGDSVAIQATITDNDDVAGAAVYYTPVGGVETSIPMTEGAGDVWSALVPVAIDKVGDITYYITAQDPTGNSARDPSATGTYTITITDDDAPTISGATGNVSADTEDIVPISATITDNIDVIGATLHYTPVGGSETTIPMAEGANDLWSASIAAGSLEGAVTYYITAEDAVPNTATEPPTGSYTVTVAAPDTTPPVITNETGSTTATTGDSVTIQATITDNDDVAGATVYYTPISGVETSVPMTEGASDVWSAIVPVAIDKVGDITYYITAQDPVPNSSRSPSPTGTYTIAVADNDAPAISGATGNVSADTLDTVPISATITDNIDVVAATLHYTPVGGSETTIPMAEATNDLWSASISAGSQEGDILYYITAEDAVPNTATNPPTGSYTITVNAPGPTTLFSDGFESGNLTTGGWTSSGSVDVKEPAAYEGLYGVQIGGTASITKSVSTVGFSDIHVKYARITKGLDSGESLTVEWSADGTTWNNVIESTTDTDWAQRDVALGAAAGENPAFSVRFSTNANKTNEYAAVDSVEIIGTTAGPVTVPDVVGLDQATAESNIVAAGLVVGTVTTSYSATVPADNVISQSPTGDSSVAIGSSVDIEVSLGVEPVTVPDVTGQTQATAQSNIVAAGLVVGTVTTSYSATVPAGAVISQNPTGGASVPPGTSVDIEVSLGVEMVTVPSVVGLAQAIAESNIGAAGLVVGTVTTSYSATVPEGNVISQSPTGGSSVEIGSSVDIEVSLGAEPVTVPDVTGQTQATAESNIVAAGLVVGTVTTSYSATVPAGAVISQNPTGGASVPPGTSVDIEVSLGVEMVTVPSVVGLAQAIAESNIGAAGLVVGTVTTSYSATVPEGNVISQSPTGGSSVEIGSSVDIEVSLGAEPVTVPDVTGQTQATAESNIVAAGLVVGTVTTSYSATVPPGDVISQNPTGGASVPPDTAVDIEVSLGVEPGDVVTITKAEFNAGKSELKVEATSSDGGTAVLTVVGYGEMTYDSRKNKYTFREKPMADPGGTVTVTSSLAGSAVMTVTYK